MCRGPRQAPDAQGVDFLIYDTVSFLSVASLGLDGGTREQAKWIVLGSPSNSAA